MKLPIFGRPAAGDDAGRAVDDQIIEDANKLQWYHCIRLTPHYVTPGMSGLSEDTPAWEKKYIFPSASEMRGKSLLDIGTMNGFFAFQAEKRGASRMLAIDRDPPAYPDAQAAFEFAVGVLGSRAEYRLLSVYDLDPADIGTFDFVLFYGVLYHLKFPLYGLYRVANVCRDVLLLETHVTLKDDYKRPLMLFYPGSELNAEPSNWWGPNPRCVDALVEHLGFEIEGRQVHDQNVQGLAPARYTVRGRRVRPTPRFDDL